LSEVVSGPGGPLGPGRIEPRELDQEMRSSFLGYAMHVIVSRALPDVRDGLKPVHRRVLYGMHEAGMQPNRPYKKSARIVGDVMGSYHPHGDTAIYDTLVRLAQPFSMRYPLVDGQGNFGSLDGDPAAAMRYCVTGDTRIAAGSGTLRIDQLHPRIEPNSEREIELEVLDRLGRPVRATKHFHSGEHPTLRVRTGEGYEVAGTHNHPVLCLVDAVGVPMLMWKLLEEVAPGDRVALSRTPRSVDVDLGEEDRRLALLLGAFASEGWVGERRAGFNNVDEEFFAAVVDAYDRLVGGARYVYSRTIASGSLLHELDVQRLDALLGSEFACFAGLTSSQKSIPDRVWTATQAF
jgi:DNA gyrase subunit A